MTLKNCFINNSFENQKLVDRSDINIRLMKMVVEQLRFNMEFKLCLMIIFSPNDVQSFRYSISKW